MQLCGCGGSVNSGPLLLLYQHICSSGCLSCCCSSAGSANFTACLQLVLHALTTSSYCTMRLLQGSTAAGSVAAAAPAAAADGRANYLMMCRPCAPGTEYLALSRQLTFVTHGCTP
jgi:hypothetical protein